MYDIYNSNDVVVGTVTIKSMTCFVKATGLDAGFTYYLIYDDADGNHDPFISSVANSGGILRAKGPWTYGSVGGTFYLYTGPT